MEGKKQAQIWLVMVLPLTVAALALSLAVGRYPITWEGLFHDPFVQQVFLNLRLARTAMVWLAGAALGISGSVYQMVFRNPLAAPDIIGVASGASAGAAVSILFFGGGAVATTLLAFAGGFIAVMAALALSVLSRERGVANLVLSGIVVSALAESVLMLMKLTADPERELASIEFWTMGSFADVTGSRVLGAAPWILAGMAGLVLLRRQILLLGLEEEDARMLGVSVGKIRAAVLLLATLVTGAVISVTGLVAFVGLLAPHIARLLTRSSRFSTALLSGLCGGILLLAADVLARSVGSAEIPISIVTSLLGAPFLFWLMCRGRPDI